MIDARELLALQRHLTTAAQRTATQAVGVVSRGALQIRRDWSGRWSGHGHIPALPASISYDLTSSGLAISAEIGPDKERRQGALGNLLEFGSVKNAPMPGGLPALAAEEPRFIAAVADLAGRALRG